MGDHTDGLKNTMLNEISRIVRSEKFDLIEIESTMVLSRKYRWGDRTKKIW